jgi:glycosyltransferase involved in cell wall biosynthesis
MLLKGVLETLFMEDPAPEYHLFTTIFNRGLLDNVPNHVHVYTFPTDQYTKSMARTLQDQGIDILFRGYPIEDELDFPLERQVVLIPDIQHEIYPEFFDPVTLRTRRHAFNSVLDRAGAVGTLSRFARKTLLEHEWTRCQDIFLVSPALSVGQEAADAGELTEAEKALIPGEDFFLYPANLWPHKNHRRVLQAFADLLQRTGRKVSLVFTGHPDGWTEIQKDFPTLPIRHLGFVRPQLLRALLAQTRALVFFSLYEGFGIPLLDAFHAGAPVLCSNTTSLPEVGGDAVLTCDPENVAAMSGLMQRILEEEGLRPELIARGKERLREYTWEKAARNLYEALLRVADKVRAVSAAEPVRADLPLVTIVTPSYNQGQYLRRTIESVLNQTYPNIEFIVMDGGSTDDSLDILRSYGNRFLWISEPDKGQTDAINNGFARGHGAVAKVVDYFHKHPECDLVYGKGAYIDKEDRLIGMYNTREYSFDELMGYCCICQPAAFWRTRIAKKVGPFNDQLCYAMDYEYWLRIDRAGGTIQHCHDLLAYSRLYPETKTLSGRDKVYQEIFAICRKYGGYVHYNYFLGFWEYLCTERTEGWARRFRRVPGFSTSIAPRLHFRWHHRNQINWRAFPRALARTGKRQAIRLGETVLRPIQKALKWVGTTTGILPRKTVEGFWGDNWIEATCKIVLKNRLTGHALRLGGTAPVNTTLQVLVDGQVVKSASLQAQTYETVQFHLEPDAGNLLTLKFSNFIVDPIRRHLAFRLEDTNLFMEHDLS